MTESRGVGMPLGGVGLSVDGYADFVAKEYLGDYVRAGGAAVRFVVAGNEDVARRWHQALAAAAEAEGYLYVAVDAAESKVHMIDHVFAAVARQVDWSALARRQVRMAWDSIGLLPAGEEVSVVAVARRTRRRPARGGPQRPARAGRRAAARRHPGARVPARGVAAVSGRVGHW